MFLRKASLSLDIFCFNNFWKKNISKISIENQLVAENKHGKTPFVLTLHYEFNVLMYMYIFFRVVSARRTCVPCIRGKLLLANVLTFWAKNCTLVTTGSCLHWFVHKKK